MSRLHRSPLFVLLFALLLSACGATATPSDPTNTADSQPTAAVAPTEAAAAPTEAAAEPTEAAAEPTEAATGSRTITDRAGREVTLAGDPERIISLAPSVTEILFALGQGDKVIAVDDFSNYPPEVESLPRIGGLSANYNFEEIVAQEPDLILAAGITSAEVIERLEALGLPVAVVNVTETTFESVQDDIRLAGELTGSEEQAEQVVAEMQQRIDAVIAAVAQAETRPRVYWELDATDVARPFTVGPGVFITDMIELAGGENVFSNADSPYPQIGLEQVVEADPEVMIMASAQYGVTIESVYERPGWNVITAIQQERVYPIDGDIVSRPTPRLAEGLEEVARLIHPDLFE